MHRKHIQDYFGTPGATISLFVTNTCNLQCGHCGTGSGPSEISRLSIGDAAIQALTDLANTSLVGIHVSGGEPFLRRRDLKSLSDLAAAEGLLLAINTNGYWASTVERGRNALSPLGGISQLLLSTDSYHAEWLDPDIVINAVIAGLSHNMLVDVMTVTPHGEPDAFTDDFDAKLKQRGLFESIRRFWGPLTPSAREVAIPEADLAAWEDHRPAGVCDQLNRSTILEDGTILACCNTPQAGPLTQSPLIFGRLGSAPLHGLLEQGAKDPILRAMAAVGPAVLAGMLDRNFDAGLREKYRAGDICTLCTDILSNPLTVAALREQLNVPRAKAFVEAAAMLKSFGRV